MISLPARCRHSFLLFEFLDEWIARSLCAVLSDESTLSDSLLGHRRKWTENEREEDSHRLVVPYPTSGGAYVRQALVLVSG